MEKRSLISVAHEFNISQQFVKIKR